MSRTFGIPQTFLFVCLFVSGCVVGPPTFQDQMLGAWRGTVEDIEVILIFEEDVIVVDGFGMSFQYSVDGTVLSMVVPEQGIMKMDVTIEDNVMTQTDLHTGEINTFVRQELED